MTNGFVCGYTNYINSLTAGVADEDLGTSGKEQVKKQLNASAIEFLFFQMYKVIAQYISWESIFV